MVPKDVPDTVRGSEPSEQYGAVLSARERAQVSQPLGDEGPLDLLALRDHVIGLEAELVNARAEADRLREAVAHWRTIATVPPPSAARRIITFARRGYAAYRRTAVREPS